MKERNNIIDVLKGIGIFLVVLGHTFFCGRVWIYSFHMPLFFLISGMVFQCKGINFFNHFLLKKVKSLLIPYLTFSVCSLLFFLIVNDNEMNIKEFVIQTIWGQRGKINVNAVLWFLPALFVVEVVYYILCLIIKNTWLRGLFCLVIAYWGFPNINAPKLIFNLDAAMYYMFFFWLGHLIHDIFDKFTEIIILRIFCATCTIANFFFLTQPMLYNIFYNKINSLNVLGGTIRFLLFIILAVNGIMACVFIAYVFRNSNTLMNYGRNSMIIMGLHVFIIESFVYLLSALEIQINQQANIYCIFISVLTMYIMKPFIHIINTYLPKYFGKF